MPSSSMPQPHIAVSASRLGRTLRLLHDRLERSREEEVRVESLFRTWEETWSTHREELSRRLEMIEDQLTRLGRHPEPPPPRLAVHFPPDAAEMVGM